MPTIYKIRDRLNQTSKFVESYPRARKALLDNPDAIIEQLEYQYKWQIVVMLENAYLEGVIDERDR
jgi:hypothetical protein|tara:strand:+ start:719 stop:916 length:198 start_codon:yes stop_codon:yes gene_type:complete